MEPLSLSKRAFFHLIVFLTLARGPLINSSQEQDCPSSCICNYADEVKGYIVDCRNKGLSKIPSTYPLQTVEIHLNQNQIEDVPSHVFNRLALLQNVNIAYNIIRNISKDAFSTEGLSHMKSLNLSHNKLDSISFHFPQSLQKIDLSYNKIATLSGAEFGNLNLKSLLLSHNRIRSISGDLFNDAAPFVELKKLALSYNWIRSIDDGSFKAFPALEALTLSNNYLPHVTADMFSGLKNIQFINLSDNKIAQIDNDTLTRMPQLKFLYLGSNLLKNVPQNLPMLEWLDLSRNHIRYINQTMQTNLYPMEFFNLAHNPLHCDCNLLWLKELWDRKEHMVKHFEKDPSYYVPTCNSPSSVRGEQWDEIADDMFTCDGPTDLTEDEMVDMEDFKAEISKLVEKQSHLDIGLQLVFANTETIKISYDLMDGYVFDGNTLEVHYHQFGQHNKIYSQPLDPAAKELVLTNLQPDTQYVICMDLVQPENKLLTVLNQCIEVQTESLPYVFVIDLTMIVYLSSLILKVAGSIIFFFSAIGLSAMLLSAVPSSKPPSSWSSGVEKEMEPENNTVTAKPGSGVQLRRLKKIVGDDDDDDPRHRLHKRMSSVIVTSKCLEPPATPVPETEAPQPDPFEAPKNVLKNLKDDNPRDHLVKRMSSVIVTSKCIEPPSSPAPITPN